MRFFNNCEMKSSYTVVLFVIFSRFRENLKRKKGQCNMVYDMATLQGYAQTRAATLLTRMNKLLKEVQSRQIRL